MRIYLGGGRYDLNSPSALEIREYVQLIYLHNLPDAKRLSIVFTYTDKVMNGKT